MANRQQIEKWFGEFGERAKQVAGADLPDAEREKLARLIWLSLLIAESVVNDLNRIADACETIAQNTRP